MPSNADNDYKVSWGPSSVECAVCGKYTSTNFIYLPQTTTSYNKSLAHIICPTCCNKIKILFQMHGL